MVTSSAAIAPYYSKEPCGNNFVQTSQTQLAVVSSSQTLDLQLMTREGDKVTLSIDAQTAALYAVFEDVTSDGGDELTAKWDELSVACNEREATIRVEGDLNKAERREIRKVLRTINSMMKKFVDGKLRPMMAKAEDLQQLKTIDNIELSMAFERQVAVARQSQVAISYGQFGEVAPGSDGPVNQVAMPLLDESRELAKDMAREILSAQAPFGPLRELADELLKTYEERAARWNSLGGRITGHIRNHFNALTHTKR